MERKVIGSQVRYLDEDGREVAQAWRPKLPFGPQDYKSNYEALITDLASRVLMFHYPNMGERIQTEEDRREYLRSLPGRIEHQFVFDLKDFGDFTKGMPRPWKW